jgi:alpha-beta hydrolase superfamily lysophospholipase
LGDLNLSLVPLDFCNGVANCLGHAGFFQSWSDVRSRVINAVETASNQNQGFKVLATGHSLGAAIASMAALELRNRGFTVDMVRILIYVVIMDHG